MHHSIYMYICVYLYISIYVCIYFGGLRREDEALLQNWNCWMTTSSSRNIKRKIFFLHTSLGHKALDSPIWNSVSQPIVQEQQMVLVVVSSGTNRSPGHQPWGSQTRTMTQQMVVGGSDVWTWKSPPIHHEPLTSVWHVASELTGDVIGSYFWWSCELGLWILIVLWICWYFGFETIGTSQWFGRGQNLNWCFSKMFAN